MVVAFRALTSLLELLPKGCSGRCRLKFAWGMLKVLGGVVDDFMRSFDGS